MIPSVVGGNAISVPAIGSETSLFDREYNDGYVRQDGLTGASGQTWYWGFNSPDQVRGDNLVFHATGSESRYSESSAFNQPGGYDRNLRDVSPQVDLVLAPPSDLKLPFEGLLVSFWYFGDHERSSFSNFQLTQTRDDFRTDFTDRFNLGGITPPLAPYAGGPDGPGPLIPNAPGIGNRQEVSTLTGSETALFSNLVETNFDLDAFSLAIGPTLSGSISKNWEWRASAGATLNHYRWSATETETLTVSRQGLPPVVSRRWRESDSDSKFRLGFFAKGGLIRHFPNNWFVGASAQVDVVDDFDIDLGESSYELSPSGYALSLSVGKSF